MSLRPWAIGITSRWCQSVSVSCRNTYIVGGALFSELYLASDLRVKMHTLYSVMWCEIVSSSDLITAKVLGEKLCQWHLARSPHPCPKAAQQQLSQQIEPLNIFSVAGSHWWHIGSNFQFTPNRRAAILIQCEWWQGRNTRFVRRYNNRNIGIFFRLFFLCMFVVSCTCLDTQFANAHSILPSIETGCSASWNLMFGHRLPAWYADDDVCRPEIKKQNENDSCCPLDRTVLSDAPYAHIWCVCHSHTHTHWKRMLRSVTMIACAHVYRKRFFFLFFLFLSHRTLNVKCRWQKTAEEW